MDEKARAGPGRESDYATDTAFLKNTNYRSVFRIFEKRSAESGLPPRAFCLAPILLS